MNLLFQFCDFKILILRFTFSCLSFTKFKTKERFRLNWMLATSYWIPVLSIERTVITVLVNNTNWFRITLRILQLIDAGKYTSHTTPAMSKLRSSSWYLRRKLSLILKNLQAWSWKIFIEPINIKWNAAYSIYPIVRRMLVFCNQTSRFLTVSFFIHCSESSLVHMWTSFACQFEAILWIIWTFSSNLHQFICTITPWIAILLSLLGFYLLFSNECLFRNWYSNNYCNYNCSQDLNFNLKISSQTLAAKGE